MKRYLTFIFTLLMLSALLLVGCTKNDEENVSSEAESEKVEPADDNAKESTTVPDDPIDFKTDIGNLNVWIGGEVIVEDDKIVVNGESNLLPGASIYTSGNSQGHANASFLQSSLVEEDGTFDFEFPAHSDITITFSLSSGEIEISDHYGENLENAVGAQIYLTSTAKKYEAKAIIVIDPDEKIPHTIPIEVPEWDEKAKDFGDPEVWMEVDTINDHKYLYFHGRSNLLEGTWLKGNLEEQSGNIVPFSYDHTYVNPDGSFDFKIPYWSLRKGMYLLIKFEPDENSWDNVKEVYGEDGAKLKGDLVHTTDEGKQYIKYEVDLDVPDLSPPEEVDLTFENEEVKMQVSDDLLFEFDESDLRPEAQEILEEVMKELQALEEQTVIEVNGHTDNVGDSDYNLNLSEQRAKSVLDYMKDNADMNHLVISTNGYGDKNPIDSNEEESGRNKNRRVEIIINPK